MAWLNYHHLLYFWTAAREGGVSAASRKLRLSQPTVSQQIKALEASLGAELFTRAGGKLTLTEAGARAFRYADEIFALGQELQDSLQGLPSARAPRLLVGVAEAIPKLIATRILEPALTQKDEVRLVCYEDKQDRLLAELAVHALDVVISDAPVTSGTGVRAYSHLLGECGVTLFAQKRRAEALRRHFPKSLHGAPFLLPTENTPLRRALWAWFEEESVRPVIRGEFQDSALLKAFGQLGVGVFPGPSAIEEEIRGQYGVEVVGRIDRIRERFYAVTVERKLRHPAVAALTAEARAGLFAARPSHP